MRVFIDALKIVALCLLGSIAYGILHDSITIHVCPEYFTVYHPNIFHTKNVWLLALGWGIVATWYMGLFLGMPIAAIATVGRAPRLTSRMMVKPVCILLLACGALAALMGFWAYNSPSFFISPLAMILIPGYVLPPQFLWSDRPYMADYIAHNVSYDSSTLGAFLLCGWIVWERMRLRKVEGSNHQVTD